MPRRLTRPEVASRLVIKAMHDASPAIPQRELAAMFHASLRTVSSALQHTLQDWVAALGAAPPGKPSPRPAPPRSPRPAEGQKVPFWANRPMQEPPSPGLGHREDLVPVEPDDEDSGVDIERSDEGFEEDPNFVPPDPPGEPRPRKPKRQHLGG